MRLQRLLTTLGEQSLLPVAAECPPCREPLNRRTIFVALAVLISGCTVARFYTGAPLHGDPTGLVEGESTKGDVLHLLGPPTQIEHQSDGDVFVYQYEQQNFSSLTLREPISGQMIFSYRRQRENRDAVVVLFDFAGVVRGVAVDHQVEHMPTL